MNRKRTKTCSPSTTQESIQNKTPTYYSHPEVDLILEQIIPDESLRQSVQVVLKGMVIKQHLKVSMRNKENYVKAESIKESCWFNCEFYAILIGRTTYDRMLDLLVLVGVLKLRWLRGSKRWHPLYRLANKRWLTGYHLLPVTSPRLITKIETYATYKKKHYPAIEQVVVPHIIKHFFKIDLTYKQFLKLWKKRYFEKYCEKHSDVKKRQTLKKYMLRGRHVWKSIAAWNIASDHEKYQWFTVCSFGYRLHHPFTYWSKEIRAYIQDRNGNQIVFVDLDLANSQPLIFANSMVELKPELRSSKYVQLVECQAIYADVATCLNLPKESSIAKKEMLHWLYSWSTSKAQKLFEQQYGEIAVMARHIKEKWFDDSGAMLEVNKRHIKLAQMMQRSESRMFKQAWIKAIKKGYTILPIHDAIYVANAKSEDVEAIKMIIEVEVRKHIKLKFKIKETLITQ